MPLRELLRREMEGVHKDTTIKELAENTDVSSSTFSNFFNYKNEITFPLMLKSIKYLNPENEEKIMFDVIDIFLKQENRQATRHAMEYLSINGHFEKLAEIIKGQLNAPKENKDWANVYELSLKYQLGNIDADDLLLEIDAYQPKYLETSVFLKLVKCYAYYRKGYHKMFFQLASSIEKQIEKIQNEYVRNLYFVRLFEMTANNYLFVKADKNKARFYANMVINSNFICAKFKYNLYYIIGISYLFDNYEESHEYLSLYLDFCVKYNKAKRAEYVRNNDLCFLSSIWGKASEVNTTDKLELAHKYVETGHYEKAIKILEEVDGADDPFHECYMGMAKKRPDLIMSSMIKMINNGNKFFSEYPASKLADYLGFKDAAELVIKNLEIA